MTRSLSWLVLVLVAAAARADEPPRATEEVLSASQTVVGEPLHYPRGASPTVHAVVITLGPGEATARHRHGVPLFAYVLEGELTVDYAGHGKRVYRKGEGVLEAMDVVHVGRNTGTAPVRILAVFLDAGGKPETVTEGAIPR